MSFPQYKRVLWIFKVKDGWEDRGKAESENSYDHIWHAFCKTTARIDIETSDPLKFTERNKFFRYCPKCMCKLERCK